MKRKVVIGLFILTLVSLISLTLVNASSTSNWWDKFGEPKYGGSITVRASSLLANFDVTVLSAEQGLLFWWEKLFVSDWAVDRNVWPFKTPYTPDKYFMGSLAERWDMTDPSTLTVYIRKGIRYADKPPANGREFTAHDVQYHYDRMLGTGSGFTEPNPSFAPQYTFLKKVNATDDYTVVFKFARPSALNFNNIASLIGSKIECRESVESGGGTISDWKTAVGTGPWVLTDYVDGGSLTYSRNPDYWGYDERHPENKLPYADSLKVLNIPDIATALAALRTGKVDIMAELDWKQAKILSKTEPELMQVGLPVSGKSLQFRYDHAPFNDLRVRKALQMSLNLPEIAKGYYGGIVEGTPCGAVSPTFKGHCYPYNEWPQSLKDEYSYNPEGAKKLLSEAAADGVFKPNEYGGFDTNCVAPSNTDLELLQIMKSYLMDIGVDMEIREMEYTSFLSFVRKGSHDQMSMTVWGMCGEAAPPSFIMATYHSKQFNGRNYSRVYSPEFDKLYDEFYAATDNADIAPILARADRMAIENHWMIYTFNIKTYNVYQPYLKGYSGEALEGKWYDGWFWARLWVNR